MSRFIVTNCAFNRRWYPRLIGTIRETVTPYAILYKIEHEAPQPAEDIGPDYFLDAPIVTRQECRSTTKIEAR